MKKYTPYRKQISVIANDGYFTIHFSTGTSAMISGRKMQHKKRSMDNVILFEFMMQN